MSEPVRQVEPAILERLGRVIVRWSLIENWCCDLFIALTEGNPGSMYVVTTNVSQSTITGWIRTLLDSMIKLDPTFRQEIFNTLTEVDEIRSQRNALAHGLWHTTGPADSAIVQTVRLERSAVIHEQVVTAADLDDLVDRIEECALPLRSILQRFGAYDPPSGG